MTNLSLPDVQELELRVQAKELVRLFQLAENKIKLIENLNGALSIPAINELRYAGYHMAQYLEGTGEEVEAQLSKAENHCKRAIYDAVEAGIIHQLELIKAFQETFASLIIKDIIPTYPEIRKQIKAARALVFKSKAEKQERHQYYEECSVHLENLRAAYDELEDNHDDLVKQLNKTNRDLRNYFMMAATLAVAAVSLFLGIWTFSRPPAPTQAPAVAEAHTKSAVTDAVALKAQDPAALQASKSTPQKAPSSLDEKPGTTGPTK